MALKDSLEIDVPFLFFERPVAVPADLRPAFRMSLLVLILNSCRNQRSAVDQIQVVDWAIRTRENRLAFLELVEGKRSPNQLIVRHDPSFNRAIDFALAEGFISQREPGKLFEEGTEQKQFRFYLTHKGKELAAQILGLQECFDEERVFLKNIGGRITQSMIRQLFEGSVR